MKSAFIFGLNRSRRQKESGLLIGVRRICPSTFYTLQRNHSFPASRLPNGRWAITKNLVDDWMVARWKAQRMQKAKHHE